MTKSDERKMMRLSEPEKELYLFIRAYKKEHGFIPGQVILEKALGVPQSTIKDRRNKLVDVGLLLYPGHQRGVYLLP